MPVRVSRSPLPPQEGLPVLPFGSGGGGMIGELEAWWVLDSSVSAQAKGTLEEGI